MKKRMRIILALSVMLFFLTACGQEDDKKITLNMAWWGS
ncbi:extracellular solute-binding protein [Enterococcus faecium]|nr:extracellular solute-binding protein [Enterococcus faecium]